MKREKTGLNRWCWIGIGGVVVNLVFSVICRWRNKDVRVCVCIYMYIRVFFIFLLGGFEGSNDKFFIFRFWFSNIIFCYNELGYLEKWLFLGLL